MRTSLPSGSDASSTGNLAPKYARLYCPVQADLVELGSEIQILAVVRQCLRGIAELVRGNSGQAQPQFDILHAGTR